MREIKFRIWDRDQHYQDYMRPHDDIDYNYIFSHPEDDDFVLMQFTGLKDVNDVEVYEGDILRFPNFHSGWNPKLKKHTWDMIGFVEWYEDINPNPSFKINIVGGNYFDNWCYSFEVIGNIYENPELISE